MMLRCAARFTPPTIAIGVARMSGQGVATTRIESTRSQSRVDREGEDADDDGDGREPDRVAIGEALHRRLARLRRADQLDDACILALGRQRRDADAQHARAVDGAAHDLRSRLGAHGRRFAGERRRIELRVAVGHFAVGRDEIAGSYEHMLIDRKPVDGNVLDALADDEVRHAWCGLFQRTHRGRRAPFGEALEPLAATLHEHDHEPGQRLMQRHRADDRERRHDVGGEVPAGRVPERRPDQRSADEPQADAPDPPRDVDPRDNMRNTTRDEERQRQRGDDRGAPHLPSHERLALSETSDLRSAREQYFRSDSAAHPLRCTQRGLREKRQARRGRRHW